ncbi:3-methyl-2-oxobutanoate hydroxymethyltransferase [Pseudofulvimonas gallinarii]|jgi:3-methyl-2-oxobutanoate hydroxymethyltransferase|uniref:3-methyl-2-oxobutanoate hydroxymethyltransferase n=1 Tax=Pseudofulvimonas gallinarii TaxID=634155 RepID=A0A4S3L0M3_9GAMM|nr:3-methyl-2-oxobutanoate hydroxymethyltransferase [Pseudofulvimonas gallinarii]TCS99711.1 ketopantoate hydroxymethyltransferase [Pseudofulvimonas gallinarii]THD15252.1 3-methyl-2-oxobutanoate hydroxymethyltransferase [Pseudofulvimonas gallinarii]
MYTDTQGTGAKPLTVPALHAMKKRGERIAALTAYDYSFAALLDQAGVDVILVGDSLGMVVQGHSTTLPVTVEDVVYHTAAVARGCRRALLVADLPFLSDVDAATAVRSGGRMLAEGGASMVKIEGAGPRLAAIEALAANGIPVCAHLGLTPQSVHKLGGFRKQGRTAEAAERLRQEALAVQQAGADLLVLENVPAELAAQVTAASDIPVIGIGAGAACDGQILVGYDIIGLTPGRRPPFSRDFLAGQPSLAAAIEAYVAAVRDGSFPSAAEGA